MNVRIYRSAKSAMQSGRTKTGQWILEFERTTPRRPESLMGWSSSGDVNHQVCLKFKTESAAVEYAIKNGWIYDIQAPHLKKIKPRNYSDNFKYLPPPVSNQRKRVDKRQAVKE